ncbi:MAG TPA: cation:proton antiporter [Thermoplasmatales archaeon]|nr:cation:proton antiporter [Thermoplasmatales archaeon]
MGCDDRSLVYMMTIVYILIIAALASSYRLFVGPTLQDRLVSLNSITIISIIILVFLSIIENIGYYLDIAIAFLFFDFAGMIAFTKYLDERNMK